MIPLELFELEKELKLKISSKNNKLELLYLYISKLELHVTDLSQIRVISSPKDPQKIELYEKAIKYLNEIEQLDKEIKILEKELTNQKKIFEEYNDRDKQIYIEKKLYKYNNAKISYRYNLGKRQINKIVKKISKKLIGVPTSSHQR